MGAPSRKLRRPIPPVRVLSAEESHNLVYFSSVSNNTHRFIERLQRPAVRIPLRPRIEGQIQVCNPYVLIVPTYGGGEESGAIPRQVADFLNNKHNRSLIRGVITSGNRNFGKYFCLAGPIISEKCGVPELYRFELLGTSHDIRQVNQGLERFWREIDEERTLA
ncbi:MAG: class Ib ribonucleoside-diphosphate reductase assembly flavoprotein NrdI [Actinomycetaceae bacterium]|nr:class Ib ribonucleoside-diphosphate reductase assembly flavoprotein NrdI [Actinomycetaceae bacterium]